ncbi:uncharacterized protein CC84DRAFT_1091103 [Paraphaeosphaeria sporulosa]|uniref:DUF7607 domain-containing protein n=1 Tax=Paraphaeosphaeria sporulosa TaxID=1460663 RepID=A0A177CDV0_9PLEO|nr:uncharacterized protein CC84DRAFT_1091103 [Paraphaeosphaeria sporulosa]OAG05401.1 hypothetical protein CC84DRAFT_1091103 [Paraphaeosphaeria sporulosa]
MEDEDTSEGIEYNDLDAAESAIRQSTLQSHRKVGKVPEESVIKIINESMETFANKWSPAKDLELVSNADEQSLDPIRLWEDAEALGRREVLVEKYKFDIQLYESKLDTLAAEICKIPQSSEMQVRHHCRNLEMHVHNLERTKWFLSIYGLPPAASEHGSTEEQHANMTPGPARQHFEVIDLGSSSESSDGDDREMLIISSIESNGNLLSSVARNPSSRSQLQQPLRNRPEVASILTVSSWNMEDLVATMDRKRVIMKVMLDMGSQEREMIHNRIRALKKSNLLKEISTCIDMLFHNEQKMLGVLPSDLPKIRTITNFFLCWWFADNYMYKLPTEEQLHELATELYQTDDLELFYDWVHYILHKTFSEEAFRNAHAPSKEEVIVISDDEDQAIKSPPAQRKSQSKRVQSRRKTVILD